VIRDCAIGVICVFSKKRYNIGVMNNSTTTIPVHNINDLLPAEVEQIEAAIDAANMVDGLLNDVEHVTKIFDAISKAGGEVFGISARGLFLTGDEDFLISNAVFADYCMLHVFSAGKCDTLIKIENNFITGFSGENSDWLRPILKDYFAA